MWGQVPCAELPLAPRAQLRGAAARPAGRATAQGTAGTAAGQCQLRGAACAARGPDPPRPCCSTTQSHCSLSATAHWHQTRESWSTTTSARPGLCWKEPPVRRAPSSCGQQGSAVVPWVGSTTGSWGKGLGRVRGKTPSGRGAGLAPVPGPLTQCCLPGLATAGPGPGSGCQMGGVQGRGLPAAKSHCSN